MEGMAHLANSNMDLGRLLQGRDTRWYRGHLAKLNLIIVNPNEPE